MLNARGLAVTAIGILLRRSLTRHLCACCARRVAGPAAKRPSTAAR